MDFKLIPQVPLDTFMFKGMLPTSEYYLYKRFGKPNDQILLEGGISVCLDMVPYNYHDSWTIEFCDNTVVCIIKEKDAYNSAAVTFNKLKTHVEYIEVYHSSIKGFNNILITLYENVEADKLIIIHSLLEKFKSTPYEIIHLPI